LNEVSKRISNAELEIMQAIWNNGGETTFSRIWRSMNYNTKQAMQTLIDRLVRKGALRQIRREVYYYFPLISREEYARAKTKELIDKSYAGSAMGLVAALFADNAFTPEEIDELKKCWPAGSE